MTDTKAAIEAVWRIESGRLIAALARRLGDLGLAEDLAQDAFEVALRQWAESGVPEKPGAWLMTTAKHLAVDQVRRSTTYARKLADVGREVDQRRLEDPMHQVDEALDDHVRDDLLRLIFTACHPVNSAESQMALTLRVVAGLRTDEIARAFLVPEATMGQRISRAKRTLTDNRVGFELPSRAELPGRLHAVLGTIYLIFNEGYTATAGTDWTRPELCADAIRLGRVLAGLLPDEPDVHGLLALMRLHASRLAARTDAAGEPVLLGDQDRRRWDRLSIRQGLASLARAEQLGGGPYTVQAAIAACHARARSTADTDWKRISALYTVLAHVSPSPVVLLNRAVAVGMAEGPQRGLDLVAELADDKGLRGYPQLPAVRADLLARQGRLAAARREFEQAARLSRNASERRLFLRRAAACADQTPTREPEEECPLMRFRAILQLDGKTATGIEVPAQIVEALGAGKRPPVVVQINGHTYRSTLGSMGGVHKLPVSAEHRAAAGISAGDEVDVELRLDDQPREVAVPEDLAAALRADSEAARAFDALSPSRRKALVQQLEGARTAETRQRRLAKAVEGLRPA